jgi:hypothetical protein
MDWIGSDANGQLFPVERAHVCQNIDQYVRDRPISVRPKSR